MDKAMLVKSKSSNSAVMSKEKVGHKTKSNAEFKMMPVKKRGVYVENQEIKDGTRASAPRRSRPGTKQFLASVLSILSKSTAGTQHPPEAPDETTEQQNKPHRKVHKTNAIKQTPQSSNNNISKKFKTNARDQLNTNLTKNPKKTKYRSRILNEVLNKPSEKMLVLQSKKDIPDTPSTYSKCTKDSNQSIKWAEFLPKLMDPETGMPQTAQNHHHVDERVAKCVIEGNQLNMQRETCKPDTLVSAAEKEEKLYKIFVNLTENVYDDIPKDEVCSIKTVKSSKIQFEMDNSVEEKLEMPLENQQLAESLTYSQAKRSQSKKIIDESYDWNKRQVADYSNSKTFAIQRSEEEMLIARPVRILKRFKQAPSVYSKQFSTKTQSEIVQARRSYHKKTKKDLLNDLKQQLRMEHNAYPDPDNFYHALRIMARNKRKSQSVQFDVPSTSTESDYDSVCRFKRRKVITPSKKVPATRKQAEFVKPRANTYHEANDYTIRCLPESTVDSDDSTHSLEVYGFDFEHRKASPEPQTDRSDSDTAGEEVKRMNDWNRGCRTITQRWKH